MRTYEECVKLYTLLKSLDTYFESEEWSMVNFRLKWVSAVARSLYSSNSKLYKYTLELGDGYFYSDYFGDTVEDAYDCDYMQEYSLLSGTVSDYTLSYMEKSPFWRVEYDSTFIYSLSEVGMDEDAENAENAIQLLKHIHPGFMEEVYEKPEHLEVIFNMYGYDEDADEGLCYIKSLLYPYVKKAKEVAGGCEEIMVIENAYSTIEKWLGGGGYIFSTDKAGYFLLPDNSAGLWGGYCYGDGAVGFDPAIIICAELIEAAMFRIHDRTPFLPEDILEKRRCMSGENLCGVQENLQIA